MEWEYNELEVGIKPGQGVGMALFYILVCRNNADAVRLASGAVSVPGARSVIHLGRKRVKVESTSPVVTEPWLDSSYLVESWTVAP